LFVSIKERTREIGILKSIGCKKRDILLEFLLEASFISIVGGVLGVLASMLVTPVIQLLSVRVEHSPAGFVLALAFAIVTGTAFGFYPAFKASRLIPVQALNTL
jgi:putative ABC transport system permease protein